MSDHKTITDFISEKNNPHNSSLVQLAPQPPVSSMTYEIATMRDQFAMAAITGLCANNNVQYNVKGYAGISYELADAMMEARK
jgi:hypothetical protein